ncbi:MAG: prepilin-type N-terminal cleavage/methylation domain-containing protein [Patescibacteria group bacterium]|nr:prepilin-type N-terminal cleavage/methylation domain-containing protein [Patescibacteria group bacterium]
MKYQKGFTLIEILVVIAILIVVISFGMLVDFSSFTSSTFQGEEAKIVSVLERARSHAMANMFNTTSGVCYDATTHSYVIFQGSVCTSTGSELIPANTNIAENPSTTFPTFVFSRLTGNTTGGIIHITDGSKSADITLNNEGTINW